MRTAKDMSDAIGRRGSLLGCAGVDLRVYITVIDARQVFSRIDYQIEPVAGSGRAWVSAGRVELSDERVVLGNEQTLAEILADQTCAPGHAR
jgi:hypothetical protein